METRAFFIRTLKCAVSISDMTKIKKLDELSAGDVVNIEGNIYSGLHIVAAIGDVPKHEREAVLYPIHCPQCPDSQIDYHRTVLNDLLIRNTQISLTKMKKEDYAHWKYAGIKGIE